VPAYAVPPVAAYNWTGIYLGANGGYAFGQSTPMGLFTDSFSAFSINANGWLAGATVGAQIQSGHVVIGLEGDIDWMNIRGSSSGTIRFNGAPIGTATLSSNVSALGTLRPRIGYALDNSLFYATAGLAFTDERSNLTGPTGFVCGSGAANSPPCSSLSNLHIGLAAGAGVEYGITQNLSAKVEYLWVGAGTFNTLTENIVRGGLNFSFGMWGGCNFQKCGLGVCAIGQCVLDLGPIGLSQPWR
jgi:outer membrane immunogenic protein